MKRIIFYFLLISSELFFLNGYTQPVDSIPIKITALANQYLSDPQNAGLMIGIYRKRTNPNIPVPPEFFSYGVKSKTTNLAPDTLTIFKLGSVGKTFTATVLAYYVVHQPNSVRLSNPMNNYFQPGQLLPYWDTLTMPGDTVRISLLDLATHHASLPDRPGNFVAPPNYTVARLLQFLGSNDTAYHVRPLPYKPGTQWLYSNTGFGTLGVVLENYSGMTYDSLLINTFCNSLNMPDTRITLNSGQLSRLATGYMNGDSTEFALPTSPAFFGAGGNYSTMNDMIKYLAWNMGFINSGLNDLLDTLHRTRFNAFHDTAQWQCLAWQISYLDHGLSPVKYIWKDGETTGYSSFVCWVRETQTGVVVLSNSSNGVDNLGINILRVLNPLLSSSLISNVSTEVPENFSLYQNYPNPFNPVTKIKFDLPSTGACKLIVYDALGKEVAMLADQKLNPGSYEVEFNGEYLSSGVYYYRLFSGSISQTRRFVLLK